MKMAIQPISRADYVSHVSFEGKHKNGNKRPDGGQHMTTAAKAIPVVVLMAMSPLTQCAAAENYNKIASSPTTEVVVQNPQKPQKKGLPHGGVETLNGEYFGVWGVSRDDNPEDAETYLFKYHKDLGDNKVAVLMGQYLAISETPREDGRYLMMYSPLDESGHVNGEYKITYVYQDFGALARSLTNSPANNNACGVAPFQDFVESFGEDAVKNAPNIEDATNFVAKIKD